MQQEPGLEQQVVCGRVDGPIPNQIPGAGQRNPEALDHRPGDVLLDPKDLGGRALEHLVEELLLGSDVVEVDGDTHLSARPSNAPGQQGIDAEPGAGRLEVDVRRKRERRAPRRHRQLADLAERREDLVRHPLGEIPVGRVGAGVFEPEHRDGRGGPEGPEGPRSRGEIHPDGRDGRDRGDGADARRPPSRGAGAGRGRDGRLDGAAERLGAVEAVGGSASHRLRHRPGEVLGQLGADLREGPGHLGEGAGQHRLGRWSSEGRFARERFVEHTAEAVGVGPAVEFPLARGLLRAHVSGGAEGEAGLGQPVGPRVAERPGDPEVGDDGIVAIEEDVLGLDVAVDDVLPVGVSEAGRDPRGDRHG